MAKMYPNPFPQEYNWNPGRRAEKKVYNALKMGLPDSWSVFYNARWLRKPQRGKSPCGEIDFVLAHPEQGILTLEVKGGSISRDANGRWSSTSKNGNLHSLTKSQIAQAEDNMWALVSKITELPGWKKYHIRHAYAACFPDCEKMTQPIGPNAPPLIILDINDLLDIANLPKRLSEIFDYQCRSSVSAKFRNDGMKMLTHLLAPPFELKNPLGIQVREEDAEMLKLTNEQIKALTRLSGNHRVAVRGCAGSGKTFLALAQGERLVQQGFSVLFVCYSPKLADFLRDRKIANSGVKIYSYLDLCQKYLDEALPNLRKSEIELLQAVSKGTFIDDFAPEVIEALANAIEMGESRYDALIIDEAQDFPEMCWLPLQFTLTDPDDGIIYVFYDDNQAVYGRISGLPEGMTDYQLIENIRNTKSIYKFMERYYGGASRPEPSGPEGREVIRIPYGSSKMKLEQITSSVHTLMHEEKIPPIEICILVGVPLEESEVYSAGKIGKYFLTTELSNSNQAILISTVKDFKGLERSIVIVTELEKVKPEMVQAIYYTAFSRAKNHLIIIAEDVSKFDPMRC